MSKSDAEPAPFDKQTGPFSVFLMLSLSKNALCSCSASTLRTGI